ncbi:hypothetical protein [Streptomyces sp. NBC_00887]|uniref:hypothetical protein n=1 Tax=Streptomyces sp. NBC_00887 TaxID=2975859 RepID=UPI003863CDDF|nr:hypothetical protein OG844_12920 [Streptomyces sp. NBC_00887]
MHRRHTRPHAALACTLLAAAGAHTAQPGEPMTRAVLPDRPVLHTPRDGTLRRRRTRHRLCGFAPFGLPAGAVLPKDRRPTRLRPRGAVTGGWDTFRDVSAVPDHRPACTFAGGSGPLFDLDDFTFTTSGATAPGGVPKAIGGKCAEAADGASADGTQIQLSTCHTGANQKWTLT